MKTRKVNKRKAWERALKKRGQVPELENRDPAAGANFWDIKPAPAPRQVEKDK